MVGDGGEGWRQRNFQLFFIANLFFIELQKRRKIKRRFNFVSFNFSIHPDQDQMLNQHFLCHCPPRKAQEQLWLLSESAALHAKL